MATITSIKLANEENIRSKVAPGSITKNNDADMRDVVANEIRDRGVISVASTANLAAQSKENTRKVAVEGVGMFEALETVDAADNVNTFPSADAGWLWKRTLDVSAAVSKIPLSLDENGTYELEDGSMIDKILLKPTTADTIKVGTTAGGDEIMMEEELEPNKWKSITMDIFADGAALTIYFTGITEQTTIIIYKRKL